MRSLKNGSVKNAVKFSNRIKAIENRINSQTSFNPPPLNNIKTINN